MNEYLDVSFMKNKYFAMSKYENIKMLEFVKRSFNDHLSQVLYKSTELTQVFGNTTLTKVKKSNLCVCNCICVIHMRYLGVH